MAPTPEDLNIKAGDQVRVYSSLLAPDANSREVFDVIQAPAPGQIGTLKLVGKLKNTELFIGSRENAISEKVTD